MTQAQLKARNTTIVCAALLVACSPPMDWRNMHPPGLGLAVRMPCRPESHLRTVDLAGQTVVMRIHVCQERGISFSVAVLDLADPGLVGTVLTLLRQSSASNIAGTVVSDQPALVPGMTPHPQARHAHIAGHLPDGRAVALHGLYFSHGIRIYQAVVIGRDNDTEAFQNFLDGIKVLA